MKRLLLVVVVAAVAFVAWKYFVAPKSAAPSKYKVSDFAGTWHTERGGVDTTISLNADGTFKSEGKVYNRLSQTPTVVTSTGKWGLDGDGIAWEFEAASDAASVFGANKETQKVVQYSHDSFVLREVNGSQTKYDRKS